MHVAHTVARLLPCHRRVAYCCRTTTVVRGVVRLTVGAATAGGRRGWGFAGGCCSAEADGQLAGASRGSCGASARGAGTAGGDRHRVGG